ERIAAQGFAGDRFNHYRHVGFSFVPRSTFHVRSSRGRLGNAERGTEHLSRLDRTRHTLRGMSTVRDSFGRPLRNLRISVTDRCNLRCQYCMPEEHYVWLPRSDILDFEEISALVDCFNVLGVDRVRLTGGEPLLRHDLPTLVRLLAAKPA